MNVHQSLAQPGDFGGRTLEATSRAASFYFNDNADREPEVGSFDLRRVVSLLLRYRQSLVMLLFLSIALGFLATWLQTPRFRATTTLEIAPSTTRMIRELDFETDSNDSRVFETARQKILSRDLAGRVVDALSPDLLDRLLGRAPSFLPSDPTPLTETEGDQVASDRANAILTIRQNLSADLLRNTRLLELTFVHTDAELAAAVANQAAQSYLGQSTDAHGATSRQAHNFIQSQVVSAKKKLEASEKTLVDYARKAGITMTGDDASLLAQNMSDVNANLARAIDERLTSERHLTQVREGMTAALPQVAASTSVQEAKNRLIELSAAYREKSATLKPAFPEMRRLNAQIGELRSQIRQEIASIGRAVEIQFEQAKQKEQALRDVLGDLETRHSDFQAKSIEYTILRREVDSGRAQYESLIGRLNDAAVASDLRKAAAVVLDPAVTPTTPYSPRLGTNLGVALILFALGAALMIWIRELLDRGFSTSEQIERELGLPVLGVLPRPKTGTSFDVNLNDDRSSLSEAYRMLRTSLRFTGMDSRRKVLLVTSTEPSEGKTVTAYKLARDFAALRLNVLVIDCDLRHPNMHNMFGQDMGIGLSNLIANVRTDDVRGIFKDTADPYISFLSAGTIPPNPSDLLASEKMILTLDYCIRRNDIVIIDAPPVVDLADAPILARQADATLFVVSAGQVPRKAAKEAVRRLKVAGAMIVGAAFTKAEHGASGYGNARRYIRDADYSVHDDPGIIVAPRRMRSTNVAARDHA